MLNGKEARLGAWLRTKIPLGRKATREQGSRHEVCEAPAGGAAAAAPEGGALAGPSASPHLPVVGAR
jgi:hypothetical protein